MANRKFAQEKDSPDNEDRMSWWTSMWDNKTFPWHSNDVHLYLSMFYEDMIANLE